MVLEHQGAIRSSEFFSILSERMRWKYNRIYALRDNIRFEKMKEVKEKSLNYNVVVLNKLLRVQTTTLFGS